MRLHVGVLGAEQLLRARDGQRLDDVDELAAAVVALARIALGVLVRQHRAGRFEHGAADEVLRRDQLEPVSWRSTSFADRAARSRDRCRQAALHGRESSRRRAWTAKLYYRQCAAWPSSDRDRHSVVISARGEQRVRARPSVDLSQRTSIDVRRRPPAISSTVIGPRERTTRRRALQRSVADCAPHADAWATSRRRSADSARIACERRSRFRESLHLDATAYRLVHGEADLLPSLVVDRYGDYLVVQALSQGMDRLLPALTAAARRAADAGGHPGAERSEGAHARRARADASRCCTARCPSRSIVREGPVEYDVDLRHGQKTGLFLDQRENREAAARYARGRLLDCFSYNGGFALRLARHCPRPQAIDISADAVARIAANAARNGAAERAGARSQRLRRAAPLRADRRALRHDRARPAGVREEQGVGRERARRLQGHQPARDAAAPARRLSGHLQLLVQRRRADVRCRCSPRPRPTPHAT